jgi:putative spermidine/putrescine transport system substrate-binding protein
MRPTNASSGQEVKVMSVHRRFRMRVFPGMIIAAICLGAYPAIAQGAGSLRFGAYGGSLLEAQKVNLGKPFMALTGVNIEWTAGTEEVYANKLLAAGGRNPPFDLVMLDEPWYSLVRIRGLAEKLDTATVPTLGDVLAEFRLPDDLGTCLFSFTSGIVYNTAKFKDAGLPAPSRWQDLANPKLSGRVGTQTLAATSPKHLLAAYAIEFSDAPTNWDHAIDAVAKIKFHSFSSGAADLMAKIEAGDVWAAPIANGRAYALIEKGLPVEFVMPDNGNGTKGGLSCTTIVIPRGSRTKANAEKLISFALTPGAQLMQATAATPYGPVIGSLDRILEKAPKLAEQIPFGQTIKTSLRLSWDGASMEKFPQYVEAWNRKVQR